MVCREPLGVGREARVRRSRVGGDVLMVNCGRQMVLDKNSKAAVYHIS